MTTTLSPTNVPPQLVPATFSSVSEPAENKLSKSTHSAEVASKYKELNNYYMDTSLTDQAFLEHWNEAYQAGLAPFPGDKLFRKEFSWNVIDGEKGKKDRVVSYTGKMNLGRAQAGDKPTELHWIILDKLNEVSTDANNLLNPVEPDLTPTQCTCALRYLAYTECDANLKMAPEITGHLSRSQWFKTDVDVIQLQQDFEMIYREQTAENKKTQSIELLGGAPVLPKVEKVKLVKPLSEAANQNQLEQSFNASLTIPMRTLNQFTQAAAKAPSMSHNVQKYCDYSLGLTTYRVDPNDKSKPKFDLFTPTFKMFGTFSTQMNHVFSLDSVGYTEQKQIQSLHYAAKILSRELAQKPDLTEKGVNKMRTRKDAKKAGLEAQWDRAQMIKDAAVYMEESMKALENLASEIELGLYLEPLPQYK